jgi:hypothetical protein
MPGAKATLLALAVLGSCALGVCVTSRGVWLDVPYVRQAPEGCGAACISMVMKYWLKDGGEASGDDADAEKIQTQLFSPQAGGIMASSIE